MRRVGVGAKPTTAKEDSKLKAENKELKATVKALTKENDELTARVAELSAVGNKDGENESGK